MVREGNYITLEGAYAEQILGTFHIIRGFAPLQDLAAISISIEMAVPLGAAENIHGFQRVIDQKHAEQFKQYIENGNLRFFPEIILSLRTVLITDLETALKGPGLVSIDGISIKPQGKSKKNFNISIDIRHLDAIKSRIHRIDGNHRLHLAETLRPDTLSPTKYLAPFCIILLGPPDDLGDNYTESMIFHTINNTALPLESEHSLRLILGQPADLRPSLDEEFANSPSLFLTRLLKSNFDVLPDPIKQRLGDTPATVLYKAANAMVEKNSEILENRQRMEQYSRDLCAALTEILSLMPPVIPDLCKSDFFIELASLAWHDSGEEGTHDDKIARTASTLEGLGRWLGRDGLDHLCTNQSLAEQLFKLYLSVRQRTPKRIFLARWYPKDSDGDEKRKARLRFEMIKRSIDELRNEGINLELDDPGTETGSTFPIHQKMYEALARNDIILVDLSGVRPNVCVEAGFALQQHKKERLIFIFQATEQTTNNPKFEDPPFDLNTYRYEKFNDAAEIPDKIKEHIKEIVENAEERG